LGSGLGTFADDVENGVRLPYAEIPGFPVATVEGHSGAVSVGHIGACPVLVCAGRFHLYEGYDAATVGFPVRVAHACGARTLFVSNAAGGINQEFQPGDLMVIDDHINLTGRSPLTGPVRPGDIRFPDMTVTYDAELRALLHDVASKMGMRLRHGVYGGVHGPSYETPAEIRMLRIVGADAVGMSTLMEVITGRALGMRVVGLSCITNMAAGVTDVGLDHASVLAMASRMTSSFCSVAKAFVGRL